MSVSAVYEHKFTITPLNWKQNWRMNMWFYLGTWTISCSSLRNNMLWNVNESFFFSIIFETCAKHSRIAIVRIKYKISMLLTKFSGMRFFFRVPPFSFCVYAYSKCRLTSLSPRVRKLFIYSNCVFVCLCIPKSCREIT